MSRLAVVSLLVALSLISTAIAQTPASGVIVIMADDQGDSSWHHA